MVKALRALFLFGVLLVGAASFGFAPSAAHAADLNDQYQQINASPTTTTQGIIFAGICPGDGSEEGAIHCIECKEKGNCNLNDVLQVFVNVSTFILGISGTMLLFVFAYGGFKWIFSRGDSKWITQGKDAITAGVIGLLIIFGAYVAINFIISGLTTPSGDAPASDVLENTVNQGLSETDKGKAVEGIIITE